MTTRTSMVVALAIPVAMAAMVGLSERTARADVIPTCIPLETTPECSDGADNDGDGLFDTMDPGCVSRADHGEGIPGYQSAPCHRIDIFLWEQFLAAAIEWPPGCPECGLTLVDLRDLLTVPLEELVTEIHPDWQVSIAAKLQQPVQGVVDNPNIPNLRFRYVGKKTIGPGTFQTLLKFSGDPDPEPNIQYVGRAVDARTGKVVTNVGILNPFQFQ